jgi:hypothetical protein
MRVIQQDRVVAKIVDPLRPEIAPSLQAEEEHADDRVDVDERDQRKGGKDEEIARGRESKS